MAIRPVKRLVKAKPTVEGAGVRLRRAFGFGATAETDPFLLLDDFRNDRPEDYRAGFPWHPHRGIETITYVLAGTVEHGGRMGNRGRIGPQRCGAGKPKIPARKSADALLSRADRSVRTTSPRLSGVPCAQSGWEYQLMSENAIPALLTPVHVPPLNSRG